ncbi:MAG: hypothetical protein EAZ76_01930 [Nostocales cyanobacterium]|nr:MAG: hypothetical protein EAZ87_13345 [Nostocales cyanobacterium]TAF20256.1 MAG: hypothetical protein EAZ76_01930 [Nostocales cyanobacterium]
MKTRIFGLALMLSLATMLGACEGGSQPAGTSTTTPATGEPADTGTTPEATPATTPATTPEATPTATPTGTP